MSTVPVPTQKVPTLLGILTTEIGWRTTPFHHISWADPDTHETKVVAAPSVQTREHGFIPWQQKNKGLQAKGEG